jgi:uncharacterized protein YndB with AHSA1/START domain
MTDYAPLVATADRAIDREASAEGRHLVRLERVFSTSIDDTWDAITNPGRIPRWFMPISGDLRPGGRYQLEGNAGGTVERCDPPRAFTATWEFAGQVSHIEVSLAPVNEESTRVSLIHIVPDDDHWRRFGPGAVGVGWDMGMLGLTLYLESGSSMTPEEAMAWMMSEDGARFMRRSNDAWAEAAIAAGEDGHLARAAAARTIAFYTGTEPPAEG